MAIITTAEFKTYRGITVSTYDTVIGVLIGMAEAQVERWCGRSFASATRTEKYDGRGSDRIVVSSVPVTAITWVKTTRPSGEATTIDSTTYTYDSESGVIAFDPSAMARFSVDDFGSPVDVDIYPSPGFPPGFRNIEVRYTGGYTTMPDDLKGAMYQYVDELFGRTNATGGSSPSAFKSETLGDYSYTRSGDSDTVTIGSSLVTAQFAKMASLFRPWKRGL